MLQCRVSEINKGAEIKQSEASFLASTFEEAVSAKAEAKVCLRDARGIARYTVCVMKVGEVDVALKCQNESC